MSKPIKRESWVNFSDCDCCCSVSHNIGAERETENNTNATQHIAVAFTTRSLKGSCLDQWHAASPVACKVMQLWATQKTQSCSQLASNGTSCRLLKLSRNCQKQPTCTTFPPFHVIAFSSTILAALAQWQRVWLLITRFRVRVPGVVLATILLVGNVTSDFGQAMAVHGAVATINFFRLAS